MKQPGTALEHTVEDYLVVRVQMLGGVAEKVVSLSGRGFFDRLCLLPGGRIVFVEVKRPKGGVIAAHQRERAELYAALGAETAIVRTRDEVDRLLQGDEVAGRDVTGV